MDQSRTSRTSLHKHTTQEHVGWTQCLIRCMEFWQLCPRCTSDPRPWWSWVWAPPLGLVWCDESVENRPWVYGQGLGNAKMTTTGMLQITSHVISSSAVRAATVTRFGLEQSSETHMPGRRRMSAVSLPLSCWGVFCVLQPGQLWTLSTL